MISGSANAPEVHTNLMVGKEFNSVAPIALSEKIEEHTDRYTKDDLVDFHTYNPSQECFPVSSASFIGVSWKATIQVTKKDGRDSPSRVTDMDSGR